MMDELAKLYQASAHHLPMIADKSVQTVITSPPYFGLRKYDGDQNIEWESVTYSPIIGMTPITVKGLNPECNHLWESLIRNGQSGGTKSKKVQIKGRDNFQIVPPIEQDVCVVCGGWRGGLGNEPTIEAYIGHLILCAREWQRILKDDGVMFVNLGDSYSGSGKGPTGHNGIGNQEKRQGFDSPKVVNYGTPAKNLMMIPQRFALAMQADGWILRSEIIWAKGVSFCEGYSGSVMPESVSDRPTRAHEQIYMFAKSPKYYCDMEAIREPAQDWGNRKRDEGKYTSTTQGFDNPQNGLVNGDFSERGRNVRDVWTINPGGYREAHFATFPEKLVEPMIKAGSREGDTVFDPFSGSGTTLRVAIRLGRKAIGVDLSEKYLTELAPERLKVQQEMTL